MNAINIHRKKVILLIAAIFTYECRINYVTLMPHTAITNQRQNYDLLAESSIN